jgi:acetylornithine deacetylase
MSRDLSGLALGGEPVALLRSLVSVPSVNPVLSPGGAGEGEVAGLAAGWLRQWGFRVRLDEVTHGRHNVWAEHGAGSPVLLFNGHLDTVGVEGMTVEPFGAELRGGRVYGRGACDMKGGVASLLAAAATVARAGHPGTLLVILTADEEHASLGMQRVVDEGIRADAAVVCEPTELTVMPAHKGFVWAELSFQGRAAHGSRPDIGVDAIVHAGRFLTELDGFARSLAARPRHPLLGPPSIHAGTIHGGTAPSVYPETCQLVLERRTLPGETAAAALGEISALIGRLRGQIPDLDVRLTPGLSRPGTEVPTESALVRGLLAACSAEDVASRVQGMSAWVDAAYLNEAGVPAVCFGPGSIAQAHAADEWIEAADVGRCARVLARFAHDFLITPGDGGS